MKREVRKVADSELPTYLATFELELFRAIGVDRQCCGIEGEDRKWEEREKGKGWVLLL